MYWNLVNIEHVGKIHKFSFVIPKINFLKHISLLKTNWNVTLLHKTLLYIIYTVTLIVRMMRFFKIWNSELKLIYNLEFFFFFFKLKLTKKFENTAKFKYFIINYVLSVRKIIIWFKNESLWISHLLIVKFNCKIK